jgi:hypothetical protein
MAMHTDLLIGMTRKGTDLVKTNAFIPENLPELYYPLDRARAFAASAGRRSGETPPASLVAFGALLDAYEVFCRAVDGARREPRREVWRPGVRVAARAVRAAAPPVRQGLAAEGRL